MYSWEAEMSPPHSSATCTIIDSTSGTEAEGEAEAMIDRLDSIRFEPFGLDFAGSTLLLFSFSGKATLRGGFA